MGEGGRYEYLQSTLGPALFDAVQKSRILCVGAGGIGCELLKNLVLAGFQNIEVIDLDTIDVSNLNRQFLFRARHVGMPKSIVAREAALGFNKDANIKAYQGNIKDKEFGMGYFKSFDLVLNALDNVNARQHVNRLCLAVDIPLVDSGTTGYLGQTAVIKKNETPCYDCQPKSDNNKSYPICTIRNTPDKPVHCIVWAKELFKLMFGCMEDSMLSGSDPADESSGTDSEGAPAAGGGDDSAESTEEKKKNTELMQKEKEIKSLIQEAVTRPNSTTLDDENALRKYARDVFDAVFDVEIKLKLKMRDGYKGAKKRPQPLSHEQALAADDSEITHQHVAMNDQRVLTLKECADLFESCVVRMYAPDRRETVGDVEFDKDDEVSLDFVTAAANLRSHVFSIERKSKFDTKGIAGNIIHAIATTNAIVAGVQVIEAFKLLAKLKNVPLPCAAFDPATDEASALNANAAEEKGVTGRCGAVWVVREPIGSGFLVQATSCGDLNPNCVTCGNAIVHLSIDTSKATLGFLIEKVLKSKFGVNEPTIALEASEIYAEGEGLDEDEEEFFKINLDKKLHECPAGGINHETIIDVQDFSQDMVFKLAITHKPNEEFEEEKVADQFIISGSAPVVKEKKPEEQPVKKEEEHKKPILESDTVLVDGDERSSSGSSKRSRENTADDEDIVSKKNKLEPQVIELDL